MVKNIKASLLSTSAQGWLERTKTARILSIFHRCCNLINQDDDILSLVTPDIGPGPFSIVLDINGKLENAWVFPEDLVPGLEGRVEQSRIYLGSIVVDTVEVDRWEASLRWDDLFQKRDLILSKAYQLACLLLEMAPPASLAEVVTSNILNDPEERDLPAFQLSITDRWTLAAIQYISVLKNAIWDDQCFSCDEAVRSLAGLGSGLTPSGDDFIIGILYALRIVFPKEVAKQLVDRICRVAAAQTHLLSAAYIHAAAHGEAIWIWHSLLDAMISSNTSHFRQVIRQFLLIGHTSGIDALAGFVQILCEHEIAKADPICTSKNDKLGSA